MCLLNWLQGEMAGSGATHDVLYALGDLGLSLPEPRSVVTIIWVQVLGQNNILELLLLLLCLELLQSELVKHALTIRIDQSILHSSLIPPWIRAYEIIDSVSRMLVKTSCLLVLSHWAAWLGVA